MNCIYCNKPNTIINPDGFHVCPTCTEQNQVYTILKNRAAEIDLLKVTVHAQAARIEKLEEALGACLIELEMQLCMKFDCSHDEIRKHNRHVIAARAALEEK
jgi:hypothetical protein